MKVKKKTIFFIGAGKESIPGIKFAKKKGLNVIVSDKSKKAPGIKFCDSYINASVYDPIKTLKILKKIYKEKVHGVMSLSSDVPLTVSYLSKKLKTYGYNMLTAQTLSDKYKMKKFFKNNNIRTPNYFLIKNYSQFKKKIHSSYKMVLKPIDSRGARGVFLLKKYYKNIKPLFFRSLKESKKKKLLLEEFISGQQLSTETVIVNKKAYTVGISDRNYDKLEILSPNIIENGSDLPSKFCEKYKNKINLLMTKIASKLKITNGTLKGDLVIKNNEIFVIEVAGRLSGGYFSSYMIPESNGINLIKIAIQIALGESIKKIDLKVKKKLYVTQRYFFPKKNGRVKKIVIPNWIKKKISVVFFDINIKPGFVIKKIRNHTDRVGQIIVKSNSKKKSIELANKICSEVKILVN